MYVVRVVKLEWIGKGGEAGMDEGWGMGELLIHLIISINSISSNKPMNPIT